MVFVELIKTYQYKCKCKHYQAIYVTIKYFDQKSKMERLTP